jgi:hypothetical protein
MMSLTRVIKRVLPVIVLVVAALAVWILIRSSALVRLSAGMDPGFFVPESRYDAIETGLIIWTPIAIVLGFVSAVTYWFAVTRWHWRLWHFALIPLGLAVLVSAAAFAQDMAFKVEAAGEVMIIGLGYGVLMPLLARRRERPAAQVSNV